MKIFASLILLIVLSATSDAADKIKIGASVPLSGDASTYGTDIKNALLFFNQKVTNNAYQLLIEDDRCIDREAATVAQKLVNIDKVDYALGFGCSGAVLAAAPVYERAKVVVVASGGGAPAIAQAGDYIFRTIPNLNLAAEKLYADAAQKFKKIGIITEETAYCLGLTEAFIKNNSAKKLLIINQTFFSGASDFRSLLAKMKSKQMEALFINPQTEAGLVTIYQQLLALDWKVQVYGAYWPGTPTFLKAFGNKADGVIYASLPFPEEMLNGKGQKLYAEFERKYGEPHSGSFIVILSFAAFDALHQSILSGRDVKSYLYENSFGSLIDGYTFDSYGDVISDKITFVLKTVKDGRAITPFHQYKNELN